MRYVRLSRYDDIQLESMLYSYRRLAEQHAASGHYALAKWAHGMVTHITIEMNSRAARAAQELERQEVLFPNSLDQS